MSIEQTSSGVWAVRQGHEHNYIDGRTHVHHIHLYNKVTGGEHNIDVLLHQPKCRECGRPFASGDTDYPALIEEISQTVSTLEANHARLMEYIRRTNVPIKLGALAHVIPTGHTLLLPNGIRMLHPPRAK